MTTFKGIPIESGAKYTTSAGFTAIRNGVKPRSRNNESGNAEADIGRKPDWLRVRLVSGGRYADVQRTVHEHRLATVCEESMCPNIGECWNAGLPLLCRRHRQSTRLAGRRRARQCRPFRGNHGAEICRPDLRRPG